MFFLNVQYYCSLQKYFSNIPSHLMPFETMTAMGWRRFGWEEGIAVTTVRLPKVSKTLSLFFVAFESANACLRPISCIFQQRKLLHALWAWKLHRPRLWLHRELDGVLWARHFSQSLLNFGPQWRGGTHLENEGHSMVYNRDWICHWLQWNTDTSHCHKFRSHGPPFHCANLNVTIMSRPHHEILLLLGNCMRILLTQTVDKIFWNDYPS